jgi:hypothetical protein
MASEKQREYGRKYEAANREKRKAQKRTRRIEHRDYVLRKDRISGYYRDKTWGPGEPEKAEAARPHVLACAICDRIDPGQRSWMADHCHESGKFRGFLCQRCNVRIDKHSLQDAALLGYAEQHYLHASACDHCREVWPTGGF